MRRIELVDGDLDDGLPRDRLVRVVERLNIISLSACQVAPEAFAAELLELFIEVTVMIDLAATIDCRIVDYESHTRLDVVNAET